MRLQHSTEYEFLDSPTDGASRPPGGGGEEAKRGANRATLRKARRAAAGLAGLGLLLAGCDIPRLDPVTAVELSDPAQRHPIELARRRRGLEIELPHGPGGLAANQITDVHRFVGRFKAESTGRLKVAAPAGARDRDAVALAVQSLEQIAFEHGLDRRRLEVSRVPSPARGWPTLHLSYDAQVAISPDCGHWSVNVADDVERLPMPNHGCANQRNFAAMLDNARDLAVPRDLDEGSFERRGTTWTEYVTGKPAAGGGADIGSGGDAKGKAKAKSGN